jgi:TolA-binding protein
MNTDPDRPGCPEDSPTAAQARIQQLEDQLCEAEQELKAASDISDEQDFKIECLRLQLETADMMLDEGAEARRKLERRIAELEEAVSDEPCPMIAPVPKEQAPPQQPGYPPSYKPNPVVEAMIARYKAGEKK